ncbi:MAG: HEAT repeat domain-containing protein [Okeania sp. SIO2C2]|uniref:HEAT repeat domain-containing protein n=1 Tax=Okeania sp. SIO2C2 TaxID=2607787 RepID=UPI0013B7AE49|nr:HEAT repeat domain-containing protein [Okeania sp. SIO2C2]NEP91154.1 HEAT repeat domain-containing protein [Okeania sp. SIO2C2]
MTISLDKPPEWAKDRGLPLTYSDRTPPKQKIAVGWVEERNPTDKTFNYQKLSWVALPLNPTYDEIKTYIEQLETNPNWKVRSQAAKALGKFNQDPDTVIPILIAALEDTDEVVRLNGKFRKTRF